MGRPFRLLAVALLLFGSHALAQLDPGIVGRWQLQWAGREMFWHVRPDGAYRLIGVGARPAEHWGQLQASGGKWSTQRPNGGEAGTYELRANTWIVTGPLGPGTWVRVWPTGAPSGTSCPFIDVAAVEQIFATPLQNRMTAESCELMATRVGMTEGVKVSVETFAPGMDTTRLFRGRCATGTNTDPRIRCIQGVGEAAYFDNNATFYTYRGNTRIAVDVGTYPANQAVHDADSIAIARLALARL
jgi:hypothetical protein